MPPSSPNRQSALYPYDKEIKAEVSTRETPHFGTSFHFHGFNTPTENSAEEKNSRMPTDKVEVLRSQKTQKFNLDEDSFVKKTEEINRVIEDEELPENEIPPLNYFNMDNQGELPRTKNTEIDSLEEISESDQLNDSKKKDSTINLSCKDQLSVGPSPNYSNRRIKHIDKIRLSRLKSGNMLSQDREISLLSTPSSRRSSLKESFIDTHFIQPKKKSCCSCNLL